MIDASGFSTKKMPQIISEMEDAFLVAFGASVDLSENGPFGQIIGILAEREALVWELMQDVYNSQYPSTASGRSLDNAVALTGTSRRPATFSTVEGVARGLNATVIPAGTVIAVEGNDEARFVTQADATINIPDGNSFKSESILLVAESSGPFSAPAGSLTNIITPVAGLESFSNDDVAEIGSNEETDSELKTRRFRELSLPGASTATSIISKLSARELVSDVAIFENRSPITDSEGRPGNSIEVLVQGDDDDDIALAIFNLVAAGISFFGEIRKIVVDSQGFSQVVRFSRPRFVPVFISIVLKTSASYPVDGDSLMKAAAVGYGTQLTIGEDVILIGTNGIIKIVENIPGITGAAIQVGKSFDSLAASNLEIGPREIAQILEANIRVSIDN